jgi:short-subunit dehydrogenase
MARVLIIGASKGIGLETTRQALEAGHTVRAFARSATDISISDRKLEKVQGNALRTSDVSAAVTRMNAVIQETRCASTCRRSRMARSEGSSST